MSDENPGSALWGRAKKLIPGGNGLLSKRPERLLPGLWPTYYSRAKGCEVWDLAGKRYLDYATMGIGACTLGYADEDVEEAVIAAVRAGAMCTLNAPEAVELAELLLSFHPWADMARFTRSGGEACAMAVRLARAFSGRDRVAFCGYHGWHDWYLAANLADEASLDGHLMPGLAPLGVPRALKGSALPFNYNRLDELEALVAAHPNEIGTIYMEPQRGTDPDPGFLEGVRAVADRIGAVLVFDEVTAGFRTCLGGHHMSTAVRPDLAVFGKALGNGHPIAAVIGKRAVMDKAQESFVSSTFWTERIGFAAALATLKKIKALDLPQTLIRNGEQINAGWRAQAAAHGLEVSISGIAPLTHLTFCVEDSLAAHTLYAQDMLDRGYLVDASVYTALPHTSEGIEAYLVACGEAFSVLREALDKGEVKARLRAGQVIDRGFKRLT